jgi:hypothetical protein
MKERNLRITIYITGIICLFAFFAIRIFPLMNFMLSDKMDQETRDFNKYGDLFYSNCINHFKQEFPAPLRKYRLSDKNPDVKEADVLTFGDSFFDFSFQTTFPERLSDTLNQKVYSFVTQDYRQSNPFCILNHGTYQKNVTPKHAIFETIERNIPAKFSDPYDFGCVKKEVKHNLYEKVIGFIFNKDSEKHFALLLKRGYVINYLYSAIVTLRFDLFGYIAPSTAKYSIEKDPWLFYSLEYGSDPGGFYYQYSQKEINTYADNIFHLSKGLKENYNIDLIFMPIPNKYFINHKMINNDLYNGFLPRLYTELDKRGIHYINLYDEFIGSEDTLYYGTDTHWNKKGVDKALNLVLDKMNNTSPLATIPENENNQTSLIKTN